MSLEPRLGQENLAYHCGPGRDARLDHDHSHISLYCVRADAHAIRDRLAAEALQQIVQRFSLALREVKLLGDSRQWDYLGRTSFKQDR